MIDLRAALRGGIVHSSVTQRVTSVPDLAGPALPELRPASNDILPNIPLYRRVGRRCLRLVRPLALPFLIRLQRQVSLESLMVTAWEIDEASGIMRPLRSLGLQDVFSMNLLLVRDMPSRWPRLRIAT